MGHFRALMRWCSNDPGRERAPTLTKSSWSHCRVNIIVTLGLKYPKGVTDPVLSVAVSGWRGRLWQQKSAPRGFTVVTSMYVVEGPPSLKDDGRRLDGPMAAHSRDRLVEDVVRADRLGLR